MVKQGWVPNLNCFPDILLCFFCNDAFFLPNFLIPEKANEMHLSGRAVGGDLKEDRLLFGVGSMEHVVELWTVLGQREVHILTWPQ